MTSLDDISVDTIDDIKMTPVVSLQEGEELGADDTFWSGLTRRRKKKTET